MIREVYRLDTHLVITQPEQNQKNVWKSISYIHNIKQVRYITKK